MDWPEEHPGRHYCVQERRGLLEAGRRLEVLLEDVLLELRRCWRTGHSCRARILEQGLLRE